MIGVINTTFSLNRNRPRVWIEGLRLPIKPKSEYSFVLNEKEKVVTLYSGRHHSGELKTSSKRSGNGIDKTLIELSDLALLKLWDIGDRLRISIFPGRMVIRLHQYDVRRKQAVAKWLDAIKYGREITCGSMFTGLGVMDDAIHKGFESLGLKMRQTFVIDADSDCLDAYASTSELYDEKTVFVQSFSDLVEFSDRIDAMTLFCGIPCTGASLSGLTRNRLSKAEEHPTAGLCTFSFIECVKASFPAYIICENVANFMHTASMAIIRSWMKTLGYVVSERLLSGGEFGAIENRERLIFVCSLKGLPEVDLTKLVTWKKKLCSITQSWVFRPEFEQCKLLFPVLNLPRVSEYLDDVSTDSEVWKSYSYLDAKAVRDKEQKKGFKLQFIKPWYTKVGCIAAGYAKARSTEPFLLHPDYYDSPQPLRRLFSGVEAARFKTIPLRLISGFTSETTIHRLCGQSVIYDKLKAVGYFVADTAKSAVKSIRFAA